MNHIHDDGVVITNNGQHSFTDPTTMVTYPVGASRSRVTDWLKSQPVFTIEEPAKKEAVKK